MGRRRLLAEMLGGGDRRSIGRSEEAAELVLKAPKRFAELMECLWNEDPIVRMRAADAAEKITVSRPELLKPYKRELLGLLAETEQIELRWHLAMMVPRLPLSRAETERAAASLRHYLDDRSSIVKTCALQGLLDLSGQNPSLRNAAREALDEALRTGTPAMKARASKLLNELKN